jgi:hypothetical protein
MEQGDTHWVMQLHYNNALNLANVTDNSGYDLCTTTELRKYDAGVLAFGATSLTLPPRAARTRDCTYKLGSDFQGVRLFSASPHMHKLGRSMSTYRIPGGSGTPEKVVDQPSFDFANQAAYPTDVTVAPGDVIRTKCGYQNDTDQTVKFGEGTGDEMCFDFVSYYPKIPDRSIGPIPIFSWITPSLLASCTDE